MIMLEVTGQVQLTPFVALSAIVGDMAAYAMTGKGLYHALIETAGMPYLPLERPPEFDEEVHDRIHRRRAAIGVARDLCESLCGQKQRPFVLRPWMSRLPSDAVLVRDIMTPMPLQTVHHDESMSGVLGRLGSQVLHDGLPALGPEGEVSIRKSNVVPKKRPFRRALL